MGYERLSFFAAFTRRYRSIHSQFLHHGLYGTVSCCCCCCCFYSNNNTQQTMSNFYHKPELALRRAQELTSIKQDDAALAILHDVLSSRRHRTWSPTYEQIMVTYLDLCLKLHRAREAKDGLHQYRNLSQSQAPGSLEKVIRYLLDKAEQQCTEAKALVDAATLASNDNDDEEGFGVSPQAILLSTMSTDPAKSQRDSIVLLPSLKFLWETYRAVLDILRSSSKLEFVYHSAAQGALRFCRVYKRRMEFRHLCDMLRMHLGNLRQYGAITDTADEVKTSSKVRFVPVFHYYCVRFYKHLLTPFSFCPCISFQVRGWEGWSNESIELHLQTRFAQLETASVLHRYTEGFRTVEDIYNILQISHARRKANPDLPPPKAKLMAAYYEKLTTLFWVSENYLFHAFAWYKYYSLCKEHNRGMSEEMKQMQASAVLLAALCIPQLPSYSGKATNKQHGISSTIEDDIIKQKMSRMAVLLGFHTRNPTREALLTEIRSKNILDQVPQYLRDLYILLEENSDPLVMVEEARPLLDLLQKEIGATTSTDKENDDVKDTTLGRYVQPLMSVLLLRLIVNLSSAYHTVSIDHLKKLTAGLDMTFEQVEKSIVQFTQTKALSVRIDHRSGCLRFGDPQLESDAMRSQLTVLSKQLEAVSRILKPVDLTQRQQARAATYSRIRSNLEAEHTAILERKDLIEKKKEEAERLAREKAREEARIKAEEEAARKAEEEKRIAREQRFREQEKLRKIQQELDNQEKKKFLAAMGKNTDLISEDEIARIDTEALQKEHQDKINKKREEAERKTREAAKKLDYLVRAIRIEELPLIKKKYKDRVKKDRELYEKETEEKIKKAKLQWESDVKDKLTLEEHSVFDYFSEFERAAMVGRKKKHEVLCKEAEEKAEVEAEKAKIRRARKRKDDEAKQKEEEARRLAAEEARAKEEEEAAKREEAKRQKAAEEEARRQAELHRMDEERKKQENEKGGKYIPPGMRGKGGEGRSDDRPRSRFDTGGYPGGGRYEGRRSGGGDDRRGWGGSGGQGGDRRGGGFDDRRGGGYGDRRRDGGRDDRGGRDDGGRWR